MNHTKIKKDKGTLIFVSQRCGSLFKMNSKPISYRGKFNLYAADVILVGEDLLSVLLPI